MNLKRAGFYFVIVNLVLLSAQIAYADNAALFNQLIKVAVKGQLYCPSKKEEPPVITEGFADAMPYPFAECSDKAKQYYSSSSLNAVTKGYLTNLALAKKGDTTAQFRVGIANAFGIGTKANTTKYIRWIAASAKNDYWPAQLELVNALQLQAGYFNDSEHKVLLQKIATIVQSKATAGDGKAMLYVAFGLFRKGDVKQAMQWYEKSAQADYSYANALAGMGYAGGVGVDKDTQRAMRHFKAAIDAKDIAIETKVETYRAMARLCLDKDDKITANKYYHLAEVLEKAYRGT